MTLKNCIKFAALVSFLFASVNISARNANDNASPNEFVNMSLNQLMNLELFLPSVLDAHVHRSGEWMIGLSEMYMYMSGLKRASSRVSTSSVIKPNGKYMMAPLDMSMNMLMLSLMYAFDDKLTVMAMWPYLYKHMQIRNMKGVKFSTSSNGFGDLMIGSNYKLFVINENELIVGLSLGIPTGSIHARDNTPMGANTLLPYPMQLGSGSFDIKPRIIYLLQSSSYNFVWGSEVIAIFHTAKNGQGYKLGDIYKFLTWFSKGWNDNFSTSLKMKLSHRNEITGRDKRLNPMMSPTADPKAQRRTALTAFIGADLYADSGKLEGNRLQGEIGTSLYECMQGPQLRTLLIARLNWSLTF